MEFRLKAFNPIFLEHIAPLFILDKEWSEKNKATKPQDFKNKEEHYAALNANGKVVFGATVTLTNVQTNQTEDTVTNEHGSWTVRFLNPGSYRIVVSATGFILRG